MKKLLLTSLILVGCPLPDGRLPGGLQKPPTPTPTPTPINFVTPGNRSPDRCATTAPLKSCKSATFGDGRGGTLFKRSDTNPKNFAFLLPGNIRTFDSVEVCTLRKCEKLPFAGCANPDSIGLRAHYKGVLTLKKEAKWVVKFGECQLEITNKERSD